VWLVSVNFSTFSAPQKYPKLLRSPLRLFRTQLQGKRGENGKRNDHFTVTNDYFQSKASSGVGCNALRSLHVLVCFTISLHVMLQTMARLPFVAGNDHFYLQSGALPLRRPSSSVLDNYGLLYGLLNRILFRAYFPRGRAIIYKIMSQA